MNAKGVSIFDFAPFSASFGQSLVFPPQGRPAQLGEVHLEKLRHSIEGYKMLVRRDNRGSSKAAGRQARVRRGKNDPRHKSLSVTISIGYAQREGDCKEPEAVIKAADLALYRAKKQGRNCISL